MIFGEPEQWMALMLQACSSMPLARQQKPLKFANKR